MQNLLELRDLRVQSEKKKRRCIVIHAFVKHVLAYLIFVIVVFVSRGVDVVLCVNNVSNIFTFRTTLGKFNFLIERGQRVTS